MPSTSPAQQRYMGMEYAKAKRGEKTDVNMNVGQLRDFAKKPAGGFAGVKRKAG